MLMDDQMRLKLRFNPRVVKSQETKTSLDKRPLNW
jgi:hypothetical protein